MSKIIGIDLGTTNSCVAVVEAFSPRVLANRDGSRTTPSIVAFTPDGDRLVGQIAKRQAITNPQQTVFAVKRLIGRKYDDPNVQRARDLLPFAVVEAPNGDVKVQIRDRQHSPEEISAYILRELKACDQAPTQTESAYLLGDHMTEADAYLYVMLRWANAKQIALPGALNGYFERMSARPAVKLALPEARTAEAVGKQQLHRLLITVAPGDRPGAFEAARRFAALGFTVYATKGTRAYLARHGVKAKPILKMHEGRPNIADAIKNGELQLVVNTPAGKMSAHDDSYIRKAAIKYKVPYLATTAAAIAAANGIAAQREGRGGVKSLQNYHAEI